MPTPGITLTATLSLFTGDAEGSTSNPARLVIALCGYGAKIPQITQIPPVPQVPGSTLARVGPKDFAGTGAQISVQLFGNYQIAPAGTFYMIMVVDGEGNICQCGNYQFLTAGGFDLSSLVPYVPSTPLPSFFYFQDIGNGGFYSYSVTNGNAQPISILTPVGATPNLVLIDFVTGQHRQLVMYQGTLYSLKVASSVPGVQKLVLIDQGTTPTLRTLQFISGELTITP